MWPSALGIAAKLGSLLSLAFVLVGRRNWLKMSNSPMIKSVIFRELFDFLSVVFEPAAGRLAAAAFKLSLAGHVCSKAYLPVFGGSRARAFRFP